LFYEYNDIRRNLGGITTPSLDIIAISKGYQVTTNGHSLLSGGHTTDSPHFPGFYKTKNGKIDSPPTQTLNGIVQLKNGFVLATDWLAGIIWKIDVNN